MELIFPVSRCFSLLSRTQEKDVKGFQKELAVGILIKICLNVCQIYLGFFFLKTCWINASSVMPLPRRIIFPAFDVVERYIALGIELRTSSLKDKEVRLLPVEK